MDMLWQVEEAEARLRDVQERLGLATSVWSPARACPAHFSNRSNGLLMYVR